MWKPFFSRKLDPIEKAQWRFKGDWTFWRWFDIISRRDQGAGTANDPVYLRRLVVFRCPLFSIMVHRILGPDPDEHLHDHPWTFLAIILRGFYIEERQREAEHFGTFYRRRWFNFCRAEGSHRIQRVSKHCTTLVITGRKRRRWGFHTEDGWVHWKEYIYGR